MERAQAKDHFHWWFGQASNCLQLAATHWSKNAPYIELCCLQQSAEFTFKAVIDSLAGRQVKTRNPYTLLKLAALQIPEISMVFPLSSPFEKKLFNHLKPVFILMRGDTHLLPGEGEMELLTNRIRELHSVVKTACLAKIESF